MKVVYVFIICLIAVIGFGIGPARALRRELVYRLPVAVPWVPPCPDCNVVLVNIDTMRAPSLPCYGYERETMPNLCGFAKRNIMFSRFFTQSSITLDSHMSVFTGLLPSTHKVINAFKDSLNPDIPTLTETLVSHGYRAAWGGITDDILLPLDKGLGRGFSDIRHMNGGKPEGYKKFLPLLTDGTPTFLFLHSYTVHSPYTPGRSARIFSKSTEKTAHIPVTPEEFRVHTKQFYTFVLADFRSRLQASLTSESRERNTRFIGRMETSLRSNNLDAVREVFWQLPWYEQYDLYMTWYWKEVVGNDAESRDFVQGLYDEMLYRADQDLTELLAFLEKPEIRRKTIVIFFSDNGEEFMEHGYFDHGWNIYNSSTHTPLIMAVPRVKNGTYHTLASAIDLFPTILDLVGIKPKSSGEGRSLLPVLNGQGMRVAGDSYLVSQHRGDAIVSIRNDRWKMYKNNYPGANYVELYDLMTDPGEQRNVLGDHLDQARILDRALIGKLSGSPVYASVSGEFPDWIDEAKRRKLMDEGYF